jgi:hypothetical protein
MTTEKVEELRECVTAKVISLDLLQQTHAPSSEPVTQLKQLPDLV